MTTTYVRQTVPSPATDDNILATHINSEVDAILVALNDFDASNCKKSGTSIPLANITNLTSTQMAAAFFKDEDDMASNSATAVSSQQAIKAFVDGIVGHDGDGFAYFDIDGTKTKVYTKYLTGTTDGDSQTNVAHGVTSGATKILHVSVAIFSSGLSKYRVSETYIGATAAEAYQVYFGDTNVVFGVVGANLRSQTYKIKVDYIL